MGLLNFFRRPKKIPGIFFGSFQHSRRKDDGTTPSRNVGMDAEHLQLRRAIERCDNLKFAVDAGQMSIADVVAKLFQNDFSKPVVKKAIAESFGEAAAEEYVK